jgi:tetratricopeptide (TPR) repeat protein
MKLSAFAKLNAVFLSFALLVFSTSGFAAGGNYSSDVDLKPIMKMINQGDYESAINMLYDELDVDPDNADIMSLLGYSYRKTQNYEDALTFYEWALKAEPDHRGANEYLGELYLETNQVDKAIEQLQILDNICRTNCEEYSKLKQMIDSHDQSASNS